MAFIISNVEPFETENDAEVAAKGLGGDYCIYEVPDEFLDEDEEDEDEDEDEDGEDED